MYSLCFSDYRNTLPSIILFIGSAGDSVGSFLPEPVLWMIIGFLLLLLFALAVKIRLLQKAAREIKEALSDKLTTDTNTLIDISTNDKHMRSLAAAVNRELSRLRDMRRRYRHGDRELKKAVTNISHDLRTPLTAIYGYLELLEKEEKSEDACRYVSVIRNRTDAMKALTEELFSYSVIAAADDMATTKGMHPGEPVDILEVLEESIAGFYAVLKEHNITPSIRMTDQKLIRMLDREALSRIFSNLLSNTVKYSQGDLEILVSENGEIVFSNTAPGLNSLEAGKLFDRFYTVDSARSSTGLGLAISRTLAEQMGGAIWACYEVNKLSIHILFPEDGPAL